MSVLGLKGIRQFGCEASRITIFLLLSTNYRIIRKFGKAVREGVYLRWPHLSGYVSCQPLPGHHRPATIQSNIQSRYVRWFTRIRALWCNRDVTVSEKKWPGSECRRFMSNRWWSFQYVYMIICDRSALRLNTFVIERLI